MSIQTEKPGRNPFLFWRRKRSAYIPEIECRKSHTRLQVPVDLLVEILLRSPAKSVARFRCVSTTWLSISTDHSFIIAHARRAPKYLFLHPLDKLNSLRDEVRQLPFPFIGVCDKKSYLNEARANSSANGLILFRTLDRYLSSFFVLNILTGVHFRLPKKCAIHQFCFELQLYYHRWTGEYRVIKIYRNIEWHQYYDLYAEVLSLAGAYSWRQIEINARYPYRIFLLNPILVNDRLYWLCHDFDRVYNILVFDILKETFSSMKLPFCIRTMRARCSKLKCGFVDIEENLFCWIYYRDIRHNKNVRIDIWAASDGDEKWLHAYSLCPDYAIIEVVIQDCFCIRDRELFFSFVNLDGTYLLRCDLDLGKCWLNQLPQWFNKRYFWAISSVRCRETLIEGPVQLYKNMQPGAVQLIKRKTLIDEPVQPHNNRGPGVAQLLKGLQRWFKEFIY